MELVYLPWTEAFVTIYLPKCPSHQSTLYPVVKRWSVALCTNAIHLKCSDSGSLNRIAVSQLLDKPICYIQNSGWAISLLCYRAVKAPSTIQRPTWNRLGGLFPLDPVQNHMLVRSRYLLSLKQMQFN